MSTRWLSGGAPEAVRKEVPVLTVPDPVAPLNECRAIAFPFPQGNDDGARFWLGRAKVVIVPFESWSRENAVARSGIVVS